ncbi:MAG: aminoglycoside phosphotransferase family protein [Phycisphaerae bacterium]|nr:aminoglycoside phosphotransferase family protein [Phycisphaerae bacterium]
MRPTLQAETPRRDLPAGLLAWVESVCGPVERITDLLQYHRPGSVRATLKIETSSGATYKVRRFGHGSADEAARAARSAFNPPWMPPVIARRDDASIEGWIHGRTLSQAPPDPTEIEHCGILLREVHEAPSPAGAAARTPEGWAERLRDNLSQLRGAGLIDAGDEAASLSRAMADRPETLTIGLVHRDLCPENIVRDAEDRLWVVDNALLSVGAIEEDAARVWWRWPMTARQREAFLRGYNHSERAPWFERPNAFWRASVIASSARIRIDADPAGAATRAERLLESLR